MDKSAGSWVFAQAEKTIYCNLGPGQTATAQVKTDGGTPPIVDNYMTAGNDTFSICTQGVVSPGALPSGIQGANCFDKGDSDPNYHGDAIETRFESTVEASVALTNGTNIIPFKLWDYGVVYGNTKLVLELPSGCFETPLVTTVGIDIKPGSYPNSVNLCSKGVVTVAILGSATFDVGNIDLDTLKFGTVKPRMVGKANKSSCSFEDVSGDFAASMEGAPDGYLDLVCQYETQDLGDLSGQSSATITGSLLWNGPEFEGTDTINIVKDDCL